MEHDQIKAFTDIVKYGSISAAASNTYTSQSYLSHKLLTLEQELNATLITRGKGIRKIELTTHGVEFLRLVNQYHATWNEMLQIGKSQDRMHLSVGAVHGINAYTFRDIYRDYVMKHPEMRLNIYTYHSRDLYEKVASRENDLAYIYNAINYTDIIVTPVFKEQFCLISKADSPYYDGIMPNELSAKDEIYIRYNKEYEIWHDQFWSGNHYVVRISSTNSAVYLMDDKNRWAIANISTSKILEKQYAIKINTLGNQPPYLTCYLIEHKIPLASRIEAIEIFKKQIYEYIRQLEDIEII